VLGARLRTARLRAGLTLRELGLLLRPATHPSTISNWERGKRVPRQASIVQLVNLFDWGTKEVPALAAERLIASVDTGRVSAGARRFQFGTSSSDTDVAARPTGSLVRFERLLDDLGRAYEEAFQDGRAAGRGEAQKELQLVRKQLASERERVERQRDQLDQLQRSADMSGFSGSRTRL
jgi:transcriptional regulator with XRE-family HTH domain